MDLNLLSLPPELLEHVLAYLHPTDIVHLSKTSRLAREAIQPSNGVLWRTAFLQVFDDPQSAFKLGQSSPESKRSDNSIDDTYWYSQLKRRLTSLKATSQYSQGSYEDYGMSAEDIILTILEIVDTAKSAPTAREIARGIHPQVDDRRSLNLELLSPRQNPWNRLENLIYDCHVTVGDQMEQSPGRPVTRSLSSAMRNGPRSDAASRLHVLYGRTIREKIQHGSKGAARRIVYSWADRLPTNDYGPFKTDGSGEIDWKVLEAVTSVMLRHFELGAAGRVAIPQGFCYSIPCRTLADPTIPEDWARVTGSWVGTYSFLDYADLFSYNTDDDPQWSLEEIDEAHGGLMVLNLSLATHLKDDSRLRTKLPHHPACPPLYFAGTSKSFDLHQNGQDEITVIGSASLCPSGKEVRWRYIISYRRQEQWQLEGIQPGGIRSGPVYGVWSQWGHDELSPVGAFLYVPEELCKRQELVLVR